MIFGHISHLSRYGLPVAAEVAAFLKANDALALKAPEIEIKGRELFVRPSEYETKAPEAGKFEVHRVYADLQYVASGAEIMQVAPFDGLVPLTEYDAAGDCQFFRTDGKTSDIAVPAGCFTVFFPGEAHRPCCHFGGKPGRVKKLVFKFKGGVFSELSGR
jgi:YhcH/YjgK/YiaL family protein